MKRWPTVKIENEERWLMSNGDRPASDFDRTELGGISILWDREGDVFYVLSVPEDEE